VRKALAAPTPCCRPAGPATGWSAEGGAAARKMDVPCATHADDRSASARGCHAGTRKRWPASLRACFPARGLPQSGSKGLSQSAHLAALPTPPADARTSHVNGAGASPLILRTGQPTSGTWRLKFSGLNQATEAAQMKWRESPPTAALSAPVACGWDTPRRYPTPST
jgi:hypothetical protein